MSSTRDATRSAQDSPTRGTGAPGAAIPPTRARTVPGPAPGSGPAQELAAFPLAHQVDLDFDDRFFAPDAYLPTSADHMERWHS